MTHLPSVVARLGETEYPEAYGGLTARPSARKAITMTIYVVAARAGALMAAYGDDWISVVPSSARYVPLGGSAR
jgi:hypothetical protein